MYLFNLKTVFAKSEVLKDPGMCHLFLFQNAWYEKARKHKHVTDCHCMTAAVNTALKSNTGKLSQNALLRMTTPSSMAASQFKYNT